MTGSDRVCAALLARGGSAPATALITDLAAKHGSRRGARLDVGQAIILGRVRRDVAADGRLVLRLSEVER